MYLVCWGLINIKNTQVSFLFAMDDMKKVKEREGGCTIVDSQCSAGIFVVSSVTLLERGGPEGGAEGERNYYCGNISNILFSILPIIIFQSFPMYIM